MAFDQVKKLAEVVYNAKDGTKDRVALSIEPGTVRVGPSDGDEHLGLCFILTDKDGEEVFRFALGTGRRVREVIKWLTDGEKELEKALSGLNRPPK